MVNVVEREMVDLWSAGTPLIAIRTVEEARAVALCRRVASHVGAGFAVWSSHRGFDPVDLAAHGYDAALDALERMPAPALAVLLDFDVALRDPVIARRLRDMLPWLAANERSLVVISPRVAFPEGLAEEAASIRLPLPDESELSESFDAIASVVGATAGPGVRHRAVSAAAGLTDVHARRAFARALRADPALGPDAMQALFAAKKQMLADDVGLEQVDERDRIGDVGGLESLKAWLAERALAFGPDAKKFGLAAPRGVLLVGVQGCGKSLSAKCAAAEFGIPLLRLDLPRVLGSSGDGPSAEEHLRRALDSAEAVAPVALWIDEIEKGFAGTTSARGTDSRATRLLGAFSTWLQERVRPVFVVATANDVSGLPPELLRRGRFDELFFVDLPDFEARMSILQVHLRRRDRGTDGYEVKALAEQCQGYSGAELEQIVVGGLHRAFAAGRPLQAADLRRTAQDLVPLSRTYEEQIKSLREWAHGRARPAGREGAIVDLFRRA